jgi:mono/diheme cytochrome c family protein
MKAGGNVETAAPAYSYLSSVDGMRTTHISVDSRLIGAFAAASLLAFGVRASARDDPARAQGAFLKAYPVFMHPRCQNCHPAGDTPLQGDDSHVHDLLRLRRGPDGNGVFAMKCSNCHQAANTPGPHTPPGAPQVAVSGGRPAEPRWHLPGPDARMVFQGRSPAVLCRQLKDPKKNGGLTPDRLAHHVATDPLVLWAWNPGEGRTPPPLPHAEFAAAVKSWLDAGGACPP